MTGTEQAYIRGFMEKCAELGIDPELMVKTGQAVSSVIRAIEPTAATLSRYASANTLAGVHVPHGAMDVAQGVVDNSFAAADVGAGAAELSGQALRKVAPGVAGRATALAHGIDRVATPLWGAATATDAIQGLRDPSRAYANTEKATSGAYSSFMGGLNTTAHGFAYPFSTMGSTVNAGVGLIKAKMDQAAAMRGSQATQDAIAKGGPSKRYARFRTAAQPAQPPAPQPPAPDRFGPDRFGPNRFGPNRFGPNRFGV